MLTSAVRLFQQRGIAGTSLADVIADADAPRGSIYHHFPGGKAQLAQEATRRAGDFIAAGLAADDGDPVVALRTFVDFWRAVLLNSDFTAGCPVAAAAVVGDDVPPGARAGAGEAFVRWQRMSAELLLRRGVPAGRAASLGALAVAAVEGAILLCRAQRDLTPLDQVAAELEALITAALRTGRG
jgi:AcrR family transcriptional regulator